MKYRVSIALIPAVFALNMQGMIQNTQPILKKSKSAPNLKSLPTQQLTALMVLTKNQSPMEITPPSAEIKKRAENDELLFLSDEEFSSDSSGDENYSPLVPPNSGNDSSPVFTAQHAPVIKKTLSVPGKLFILDNIVVKTSKNLFPTELTKP